VAVLDQPCLQVTHALQQHGDLLALPGDLGFQGSMLFLKRYASMLHLVCNSGWTVTKMIRPRLEDTQPSDFRPSADPSHQP